MLHVGMHNQNPLMDKRGTVGDMLHVATLYNI